MTAAFSSPFSTFGPFCPFRPSRIHFLSDDLSCLNGSVFVLRSHSEAGLVPKIAGMPWMVHLSEEMICMYIIDIYIYIYAQRFPIPKHMLMKFNKIPMGKTTKVPGNVTLPPR